MHQPTYRPSSLELSVPSMQSHRYAAKWTESVAAARLPNSTYSIQNRDGLQTPPADEMCAAYPNYQYNAFFQNNPTHSSNLAFSNTQTSNSTKFRSSNLVNLPPLDVEMSMRDDRQPAQAGQCWESKHPSTVGHKRCASGDEDRRRSNASDSSQVKLQIPSTISSDGGSLSDFAAQITCLFWFETIDTLNEAEGIVPPTTVRILKSEALPSAAFKKWVSSILTTTQVSDKVIILALLFIYRLKKYNPSVKGRSGSEYRLLTVALMLGNKFLDDNTYTNSTWAEVSGISVQEIHVMEVEFLSNMRYSLVASKEEWEEWQGKLRMFKQYCEASSRASVVSYSLPPMPSPPESTRASPPLSSNNAKFTYRDSSRRQWPIYSSLSTKNLPTLQPTSCFTRKRSLDIDVGEPTVKKMMPNGTRSNHHMSYTIANMPRNDPSLLPPISTEQSAPTTFNNVINPGSTNFVLPPLGPLPSSNSKTSSDNYMINPSTPSWTSQLSFSTPTRRITSPQNLSSLQDILSYNSSPISANPNSQQGHISPSVLLQQRSSPYNPVRHVNTLLYPPPFGSVHDNSVNAQEMRYRTIGKRNENLQTGVVPYWPANWQSHFPS